MFLLKYSTVFIPFHWLNVWFYEGCMQCNYIRVVYSFIKVQTLFCLITSIQFYISQCIEDCEDTSYKDLWTVFRKLSAMNGYSECQLWLVCNPGRVCFSCHHITIKKKTWLSIKQVYINISVKFSHENFR